MAHTPAIERLSAIAGEQLGLFSRSDAREAHVSNDQLRRLTRRGIICPMNPNVFRFSASSTSWRQRVLAACLDGGAHCVASHRTAAALHKFDGFEPGVVEVLVPMHVRHRRKDVIVHHTRFLPQVDRCRIGVIPVTSRARTLIDLGAVEPAERVEEAFDGAERDRDVGRGLVEARYAVLRAPGRNGIGAMTQILQDRVPLERLPRSVLERRMSRLLVSAGLPTPYANYRVRTRDGTRYTIDFAYVAERIAIEVDGHGSHATRRQRASDNIRGNALGDAGWTLRRFTYEQVVHDPSAVAAVVRASLKGRL